MMNTEHAACCCGNIEVTVELSMPTSNYSPRACDCDFCTKHGAAYISDPKGKLAIKVKNSLETLNYKNGSGVADFLTCKLCGVFVVVTFSDKGLLSGSLNSRTLVNREELPQFEKSSPKLLSDIEKVARWEEIWFQNVTIEKNHIESQVSL